MTINPEKSLATSNMFTTPNMRTLQDLLAETRQYLAPEDIKRIEFAYDLVNQAHIGMIRRSGEPYIRHSLEIALLLADMRIDADGIIAALLHDMVEDTSYSLEDLQKHFGTAVASIVDGVTKFDALVPNVSPATPPGSAQIKIANDTSVGEDTYNQNTLDKQAKDDEKGHQQARDLKRRQRSETVRKLLLAMAEDPRVVVLKLADRLHNMRTLDVMNPAQQQNKARQTNEIYAPLARRLGMILVQAELEDLALSYLEPEKYARLAREVEEELSKRQAYVDAVCRMLQEEMERAGIHAEVHAWQKHLASINRKLQRSGGELSQLHDLVSFRILVNSEHDCYLALGHIHGLWRPKDGRIKDFIATPKLNGYQSLHTAVFCLDNRLAEIQIRTHDMQRTADYGIASYWYMKERGGSHLSYRELIAWIEQLREWQRELPQSADEFVEAVKGDIFQEQIFVFTPKGEVKDLPRGSTPLDMAYRIHTDLGEHCAGARIITNLADTGRLVTRLVPLDYELQGGEIVDIVVNHAVHPTRDWLSFARTAAARSKIRRYLKTYERELTVQLGQERLDLALKAAGVPGIRVVRDDDFLPLTVAKKYSAPEDIYVALGRDDLQVETVVEYLLPTLQNRGDIVEILRQEGTSESGHTEALPTTLDNKSMKNLTSTPVKLAHCCCPIPGDAIVGLFNPGKGIFVHQSDCRTLRRYRERDRERLVEVNWLQIEPQQYLTPITIVARDRAGLLRDVAAVVSDTGINMTAVTSNTNASLQKAIITATLEIESVDQIDYIFKRLRQVKNVVSVSRTPANGISSIANQDFDHYDRQVKNVVSVSRTPAKGISGSANQDFDHYDWEIKEEVQRILHQTLFRQGIADRSLFPEDSIAEVDHILERYMLTNSSTDLEYDKSSHSLRLRTAEVVQQLRSLIEPVFNGVVSGTLAYNNKDFEEQMEKILQSFSSFVGLGKVSKQDTKDFATFLIDTEGAFENLRVPNPLPILASTDNEITDVTIQRLRRLLISGKMGFETHIAILILFNDKHQINTAKGRIAKSLGDVYACDVVVINHEDLLEIVSAKEPDRVWRRFVLSQVRLAAIDPYTVTGPTPTQLFFGREHELREISDHLNTTSYIVIGGRRIGKTSLVRHLHSTRLPALGFRTLFFDCSMVSSYNAFLSASIRDWKPEAPTDAPTTFSDFLQLPPNDKPLVLLLDEADKLVPIDRKNDWQIFSTLRALVNSQQLQIVLSGERTLREALKDATSPLFNLVNEILLGPLDFLAVEELVTQPMKQLEIEIANPEVVTRHIYNFTSGHPNVVQRLCRRLIEQLKFKELENRRILLKDVIAITEDPHFQEIDFLQTYWEAATPLEKIVTLALSKKRGTYRLMEVRQLISDQAHILPSATETKDALDRLVNLRSILKWSPIGYEFAVEAFPRVIVNTTTIEDLLEVLVEQYKQTEQQL